MTIERNIAIKDFYGFGKHIYDDQMGFTIGIRKEMRSNVAYEIFEYALGELGYEMGFFYTGDENFYFIATIESPIQVLRLPRDKRLSRFIGWQCEADAYEFGTIVATFDSVDEIWNNFRIGEKSLEEIIPQSYILRFC